ncbi:hypothetical protein BDV28DRAFT_148963 [Aspergillus coremiiformis]|uniref:Rhodopsin domain-containing protein n=1 Tax=Aspergillus coremiiformis TaxID=138285 RepID=A0A5N6Z4C5_9EURO|nr:hypothetical protein BDV28DRAFT_148963 [Aspergillus coremiiformis]
MPKFKAESWTWYGVTALVIILRFVSRLQLVKAVKSLQAEDYFMLVVLGFYTALVVILNRIEHAQTNLMDPNDEKHLAPESIQGRIYGSKLVVAAEQCMLATVWGCKGCLLLLYARLTEGIRQQLAVKILAGYVVGSYLLLEILYFAVWCRPFYNYWAVPTPNDQCSTATHHLIMTMVFNVSSDILMMCIPLPLLISASLPVRSKIVLVGVFGMGTFLILCATLSKVYSFKDPFGPEWLFWYVREASTAACVANIPNCWSLVRRVFHLGSWTGSLHSKHRTHHYIRSEYGTGTHSRTRKGATAPRKNVWTSINRSTVRKTESVEEMVKGEPERATPGIPLEIWHQTSIHVLEESHSNDSNHGAMARA